MTCALITVEGVLRKTVGGYSIAEGVRLYQGLKAVGSVYLVTSGEQDQLLDWLDLEGIARPDNIYDLEDGPADAALNIRAQGIDLDMVIDPDPLMIAYLTRIGYNTLLFLHAQYAHPAWRPDVDTKPTPWGVLMDQIADDLRAKADDKRLSDDG